MEFLSPQRRKFDFLKWDEDTLSEPSHFQSLSPLKLILLLEENGKEAAFLELLHSPDILSGRVSSNDAFMELQTPQRAVPSGRRMEPKPENVLKSHEHPKRETKDETKVQKK